MCEHCGGRLLRSPTPIGTRGYSSDSIRVSYIMQEKCSRCGRTPSVRCEYCSFRTFPCAHCGAQRCECSDTHGPVHWYAGKPLAQARLYAESEARLEMRTYHD